MGVFGGKESAKVALPKICPSRRPNLGKFGSHTGICEYGVGGAFEGACTRHAIVRSAQWHGHRTDGVGIMVHDGDVNEVALDGALEDAAITKEEVFY